MFLNGEPLVSDCGSQNNSIMGTSAEIFTYYMNIINPNTFCK